MDERSRNIFVCSAREEKGSVIVLVAHHSLTHSWSWALLAKLSIVQLLKNFPAFYGTQRFISVSLF
jgi:hypothetical protein